VSTFNFKTIGVFVGPQKPEALAVVTDLHVWCQNREIKLIEIGVETNQAHDESIELPEEIDLLVVLGGDGTMLGAARLMGNRQVPVLGVNFGWLGYLTEFTLGELFLALDKLSEGELSIDRRMLLDIILTREGKVVATHRALNDAVINHAAPVRMIELECYIDDMFVNRFRADGMIIATPTGSTAYSLSAGGPIVHPGMSAIMITPICPHMLSNRPVVVRGESVVELVFKRAIDGLMLTIDGQQGMNLMPHDRVTAKRSKVTFDLIRPTNRNYFEVLRTKLKWGGV